MSQTAVTLPQTAVTFPPKTAAILPQTVVNPPKTVVILLQTTIPANYLITPFTIIQLHRIALIIQQTAIRHSMIKLEQMLLKIPLIPSTLTPSHSKIFSTSIIAPNTCPYSPSSNSHKSIH